MPQDIIIAGDKAQPLGRYPHTRKVGPWIFISGTSSRRPDNTFAGAELIDGQWKLDIRAQTQAVMENIQHYLNLNGCDMEHLVDVTVFLKDMAHLKFTTRSIIPFSYPPDPAEPLWQWRICQGRRF